MSKENEKKQKLKKFLNDYILYIFKDNNLKKKFLIYVGVVYIIGMIIFGIIIIKTNPNMKSGLENGIKFKEEKIYIQNEPTYNKTSLGSLLDSSSSEFNSS